MAIAILCPTRRRPEQCSRMIKSAHGTSKNKINILLGFTGENYGPPDVFKVDLPDYPTAMKWNALADIALKNPDNKLFMLGADDMVFDTPGWDAALLEKYDGKPHVYSLRDSRDPYGTPHPIVTREWIEAMGYFLPPIMLHWFVDSWTVEIAKANRCFTHLRNYLLIHDKPSDNGNGDDTHNRIRKMGWRERDAWVNDHCQHYLALEKSRLKMKMVLCEFG